MELNVGQHTVVHHWKSPVVLTSAKSLCIWIKQTNQYVRTNDVLEILLHLKLKQLFRVVFRYVLSLSGGANLSIDKKLLFKQHGYQFSLLLMKCCTFTLTVYPACISALLTYLVLYLDPA